MLPMLPSRLLAFLAFAPAPAAPFMHFTKVLEFPKIPFESGLRRIHTPEQFSTSFLPVPCLRLANSSAPEVVDNQNCVRFACAAQNARAYRGVLVSTRATESRLVLTARSRHMLTVWLNVSRDLAGDGHTITMRVFSTGPYADRQLAGPLFSRPPRWLFAAGEDPNLRDYRRKVLGSIA